MSGPSVRRTFIEAQPAGHHGLKVNQPQVSSNMSNPSVRQPVTPGGSPIIGSLRNAWCGELRPAHAGLSVTLCGWVHGRRDLGGLCFVDLRDRSGVAQIVVDDTDATVKAMASSLRSEFAVRITGTIATREGARNTKLASGEVEVRAASIEVLAECPVPPFQVEDDVSVSEELRLQYRYLDLRRPRMQGILALRHRVFQAGRRHLSECGLLEIETPILFKSTPEGARDYLVPSRVSKGSFYALPQSPQMLKQVLMVSGCEGYYQMARCFRDEDLRANRQPEFTQMDLEIAFGTEEDVFRIVEGFVQATWAEGGFAIPAPFRRLTYRDSMSKYGSDKPDLRFGMEFADVTTLMSASEFPVTKGALERGDVVRALAVPGGASFSRKELDQFAETAKAAGASGLAHVKVGAPGADRFAGPPVKSLPATQLEELAAATKAAPGDLIFMVSGVAHLALPGLSAARLAAADKLGLRKKDEFCFAWVHEFPLYDKDPKTGEISPAHHPFCMPNLEDMHLFDTSPEQVRARTYDLVCNGEELGSGSIRIHRQDIQARIFRRLGLSDEEAHEKFGFFLTALAHGAPPHGGIALGMDRVVMLMAGTDSIRDVVAFPKTASASDLMAGCPSPVSARQLAELAIRTI